MCRGDAFPRSRGRFPPHKNKPQESRGSQIQKEKKLHAGESKPTTFLLSHNKTSGQAAYAVHKFQQENYLIRFAIRRAHKSPLEIRRPRSFLRFF